MKRIIALVLPLLLIFSCTKKPSTDTLLRLGGDYYTLLDFFEDNNRDKFIKFPDNIKKNKINEWAKDEMFYKEALELYQNDENVKKRLETNYKNQLITAYLNRTILDSIISDRVLQDMYDKFTTEVKVSHILIKFSDKEGDKFPGKTEAHKLAKEITNKARGGTPFYELAKKYSDDETSLPDGDLGWASMGQFVPAFEDEMYTLDKNEISDPVFSKYGFHIIKVYDKRKNSNKSFEELKPRLKRMAINKNRQKLQNEYQNLLNKIKNDVSFELNNSKIEELVKKFSEYKKVSEDSENILDNFFKDVDINGFLVKTSNQEYDINWFKSETKESGNFRVSYLNNARHLSSYIQNSIISKHLKKKAEKMGIQNSQDFQDKYNQFRKNLFINKIKKENIYSDIDISDEKIEKYYEKHKNDKFMEPAKSEVREIYVRDRDLMDSLRKEIETGANFDSLSQEYTERRKRGKKAGYYGFITNKQYGSLGRIADKLEENTISDSLLEIGAGYSLIKVYDKKETETKPLKKVRSKIISELKNKVKSERRKKFVVKLKRKYNFKIYWDTVNLK